MLPRHVLHYCKVTNQQRYKSNTYRRENETPLPRVGMRYALAVGVYCLDVRLSCSVAPIVVETRLSLIRPTQIRPPRSPHPPHPREYYQAA
jgi:hypothetical protein